MNELLEDVLSKLEKSEVLLLSERNTYLSKLKSQTIDYQRALEQQSMEHMQTLKNQEQLWKQTLQTTQNELMQRLSTQIQKTEVLQEGYEGYLKELISELQILKNQLKELSMK